jgi:hypothetical protein
MLSPDSNTTERIRKLSRRPPNRPFRDQLFEGAGFEELIIGVAGGACRRLQAVLESEGER